ncbi:D-alanyl-D-alanine carboxypeptidase [Candidatus Parcubacteria bacterium]|nr:D-alanyl-D-alanine carboxypeptidase [Candidatus Parcubacteria bacterium]
MELISSALLSIYLARPDLQAAFDPVTYRAVAGSSAGLMLDLADWAERYGWREHQALASYAPEPGTAIPVRRGAREVESQIGARAYTVLDRATGELLTVKREHLLWPVASLTKLATASVVLDYGVPMGTMAEVLNSDHVGGARLSVNNGDTLSVSDLFVATLVASANNAANALARTTGLSKEAFVSAMNAQARRLNLSRTQFVEPSGIEPGNVSTPLEMARLARDAFSRETVRSTTTTATKYVQVASTGAQKKMINTNWMLWKPQYDDLWVTAGKTGYLDESGWNLAVSVRPNQNDERELLIVLFGAVSRSGSFQDAERLARWAWDVYEWRFPQSSS